MSVFLWPCLGQPATNHIFSEPYHTVIRGLLGASIYFHVISITNTIFENIYIYILKIKRVFWFSQPPLTETFLLLKIIYWYINKYTFKLNLIKTSLMHSSSVLLHLNPLYMFRMQFASILRSINMYIQVAQEVGTRRAGEQIATRALSCTTCMYILMLLRTDASCIRNM